MNPPINTYLGETNYYTVKLQPLHPTTILEIQAWCRDYERRQKFPATHLKRFAIGFYQIHQGMDWKDNSVNKYESFAASVLHFFMLSEALKLPVEDYLYTNLVDYISRWKTESGCHLLKHLSRCQQQLFYADTGNKTQRKSRYDKDRLTINLADAIGILIGWIPEEHRTECFEIASTIVTKELK